MKHVELLHSILNELEIAILHRTAEEQYELVGTVPSFYTELYPGKDGKACHSPWEYSDMLAFFIKDAELFFSRNTEGQHSSGIWQEDGVDGNKALMAQAVRMGEESVVIVRRLGEEYMERVRILRKARENLLERRNLNSKIEKYKTIAKYDGLTNLLNRTTFMEILAEEIAHAQESGSMLALLVMDIDDFKLVNDTFGHIAGDAVLTNIGKILGSLRSHDIAARYGGEEFVVLSPGTDLEQAVQMGENIRKRVENYIFPQPEHITISIGCTIYSNAEEAVHFFERADFALYDAKHSGKNTVKVR